MDNEKPKQRRERVLVIMRFSSGDSFALPATGDKVWLHMEENPEIVNIKMES